MIEFLAAFLFDFRTIAAIVVIFFTVSITLCVRLNLRDRAQAGVSRTTKAARASERAEAVRWPEPDTSGDRPSLIVEPRASTALGNLIGTDPIGSREFDGRVIFYSPRGPVDLSRFFRDVPLSPDGPATLEVVNDSTARGDHVREAPDRPEHEGDQDRPTAILEPLDGDEPLRAGRAGRAERTDDGGDPFDGADPVVFGRAGAGTHGAGGDG